MTAKNYTVKQSAVHGKGVFAARDIEKGELIIEYKGERISDDEADNRHPANPDEPNHTFYFSLSSGGVIDANFKGNSAKWINHSCAPNCEAKEDGERVFIFAKKAIKAGAELNYDYHLTIEEKMTAQLRKDYECRCGTKKCRGTLLLTTL